MNEAEKRMHRCAFTGHRPEKLEMSEEFIRKKLEEHIINAYQDGFFVFISGMARGVDMWAADIVIKLREKHHDIKLICAVPFPGFEKRWSEKEQTEYGRILGQADLVRYISQSYSVSCFQIRNEWMVDRAARLIAVWNGKPSGTGNTVNYARLKNIEVINIL